MNGSQTFFRKATLVATFSIITVLVGGLFVSVPAAHATTSVSPGAYNVSVSGTTVSSVLYLKGSEDITWSPAEGLSGHSPYTLIYSKDFTSGANPVPTTVANSISASPYSWDTTKVHDGTYKVRVIGKSGGYGTSDSFIIDNTPPVFSSVSLVDTSSPAQSDTANVKVTDAPSGVDSSTLKYGFSSDGTCGSTVNYGSGSSNAFTSGSDFTIAGNHTDYLCVEATDNAGNTGYKQVGQLNTDNTAPTISTVTGTTVQLTGATPANDTIAVAFSEAVKPAGNGAWSSSDFTFKSSSGTTVDLSGAAFAYDSSTKTLTVTLDGANAHLVNGNTVTVTPKTSTVEDLAGNFLSTTAVTSAIIKGDTIKPTVALTYTNNGPVKNGDTDTITATFNEVIDGTPKISIAVPGTGDVSSAAMSGSGLVWTYPWTVTKGGTGGTATVSINAQDLAGNQNAVATSNTIAVDNTAPTITSYTLNGNNTDLYFNPTKTSAVIALTASEPVDWTTIRVESVSTPVTHRDFHTITTLNDKKIGTVEWNGKIPSTGSVTSDGVYKLFYTITDNAGNVSGPVAGPLSPHRIIVDTQNPTISINSPVANHVVHNTSGGVSFVFSAADTNLDKCAYKIDSGSYNSLSCSSPQTLTLKDGRQTVTLKATDKAGNSKTASVDFVVDTDGILTVAKSGTRDFSTIQSAINAAKLANSKGQVITTINVAKGQYGKTNIDTPITINGVNASINPNGATPRISESTISASNGAAVTINSNGVTLKGFTITSSGGNGVKINSGFGTENFSYNIFSNITNSNGPVYGISIGGTTESEGINISNNAFDSITTTVSSSYVTPQYAIAYGIYTNNSAGADLTITDNSFSNLSGFGTHAIGLEGPTKDASITGNTFSNLSATASGRAAYDKFGIFFQYNPDGGSVTVHENKFIGKKGDFGGVAVSPKDDGSAVSYTVNAENNWWGSGTGPYSPVSSQSPYSSPTKYPNPNGLGVYVSPNVDFTPYYVNESKTILSNKSVNDVYVNKTYTDVGNDGGHIFGYNAFATIQNGVDASALVTEGSGKVQVADGTYSGNVTISKALTLEGPNATINPNTPNTKAREQEAIISGSSTGGVVTVASDDVTVNGLTITNDKKAGTGIYSADNSGLTIQNNIITNIGNSSNDIVGRGIEVISSAKAVNGVSINDNKIDNITSGLRTGKNSTSASGISIGWSTGSKDITNLSISDNVISSINADTSPWSTTKGQGAYGIMINHKTTGAQITGNTISTLEGLWAHAIGLEGNTPNAVVTGNTISGLTDNKGNTDAFGVFFQDNPSAASVTVDSNRFNGLKAEFGGVGIHPDDLPGGANGYSYVVNAEKNWWGSATGPFESTKNPNGLGTYVTKNVNFNPFYNSDALTKLVSSAQIASFDLSFGTNPQKVNKNSILTVTAKDANNYTVVNATPQINIVGHGSATFPGGTLLTLGKLGSANTTIKDAVAETVNVNALEVGGSAAGTGSIVFSAISPVIPTIALKGIKIASPYTVSEATTRFPNGLQFTTNHATSFTVNGGASESITSGNTITVASPTDAITTGLHLYTVVVTSSTGNTVTKTVGYQVNANIVTPIIPTIALNGGTVATQYTQADAGTRFTSGLQFDVTKAVSYTVTVNGVTSPATSVGSLITTTITATSTAAATTLGLHSYKVTVKSSTGDFASKTVTYNVNANPTTTLVISNIQALDIGTSTVTVSWITNENADSTVDYGLTSGYGTTEASSSAKTHKVVLSGLIPNTGYHFRVVSKDSAGNVVTSTDNTFATTVDNSIVKNVVVTNIAASSTMAIAGGSWKGGWSWVFDVTVPTNETKLSLKFKDFKTSDGVNVIPVASNNISNIRFYSPQAVHANSASYAMKIKVAKTFSDSITLGSSADLKPNIPGRQIKVIVEMKVPSKTPGGSYSSEYALKSEVPTP